MSYDLANPTLSLAERITDDPTTIKTAQSTATLAYQANIAGKWHNVTIMWCKNLMNHSLNITLDSIDTELQQTCKIDLKAWYFWTRKGLKSMELGSHQINVFWDFRCAKFSSGSPEPCSDYYVALVSNEEVILLLGDNMNKAYKRTNARPALQDPLLFYKKENVFGKKAFSTRARLGDNRAKEHDVTVDSSITGSKDPELWISVDGVVLVHVKNLHWKFRGNETVVVNKQKVQVFWDVHDWLFKSLGAGRGLFIFKPTGTEGETLEGSNRGANSDGSTNTRYYPTCTGAPDFCFYLYAWKIE